MKTLSTIMISFLLAITFTACDTYSPPNRQVRSVHHASRHYEQFGRVTDIEVITQERRNSGGGAVLGAILGGVVGHQMGSGRGRDVATGVGAIGGAVAGNQIERRNGNDSEIYRVTVHLENGRTQVFDYENIEDLRVGDRVRIRNGQIDLM